MNIQGEFLTRLNSEQKPILSIGSITSRCSEIKVYSNDVEILQNLLQVQKTQDLSSLELEQNHETKAVGHLRYEESDVVIPPQYDVEHQVMRISGPKSMFSKGRALYYAADYMAECLSAPHTNSLIVHSAAVFSEKTGLSYLILGEKGSGKTTLSLRLCEELGLHLIGNDLVRIGQQDDDLFTFEGSKWFDIRETATRADRYLGKYATLLASGNFNAWNNKTRVLPDDIGITTHSEKARIDKILNIRIDPYQPYLTASSWEGIQRNLILHEKVGRHITGQATPFQDDNGNYLGSLPAINLLETTRVRDNIVMSMINKGITELYGPNSESLAEWFKNEGIC